MKKQFKEECQSDWKAWNETITASQKRIKYTHWLAHPEMKTRQKTIHEAFVACGVLNAIDGSEDHLIKLNGVDTSLHYKVVEPEGEVVYLLLALFHLVLSVMESDEESDDDRARAVELRFHACFGHAARVEELLERAPRVSRGISSAFAHPQQAA